MVLWLTVSLLDHFDLQTSWIVKIKERYNGFLSLKVNIPSIESVLSSLHAILRDLFHGIHTIKIVVKVNNIDQTI